MSGGWKNSTRRQQLPSNWTNLRNKVIRRDNGRCVLCGDPGTDVDHIVPGDNHSLANLRLLCSPCHGKKTAQEGGAALAAKRRAINSRLRRTESHPGLL